MSCDGRNPGNLPDEVRAVGEPGGEVSGILGLGTAWQGRLAARLGDEGPALTVTGDSAGALARPSVAVFSSVRAPGAAILRAHDLAQEWRKERLTVISGFHSPVEEEVWAVLMPDVERGAGEVVLVKVLARGMVRRLPAGQRAAIEMGRLVLVSPFPDKVRRATRETAYRRNQVAAALADRVIILHAEPGSRLLQLA